MQDTMSSISKRNVFSLKNLVHVFFGFYAYICFAPSIRLLLVGGKEAKTLYEFIITALPDLLFLLVVMFSIIVYFKGERFKLTLFDKLIIFFVLFNTVYGTILSHSLVISAQGFRVTYLATCFYFIGRLYSEKSEDTSGERVLINISTFVTTYVVIAIILHFVFSDFEKSLYITNGIEQYSYFIPRMGSFIIMPVVFGTIVSFACLYFYYRLIKNNKWWNYLFVAVLWSGIFLSVSRGPIISFLFVFILLTIISREWIKGLINLCLIIFISGLLSWILTGSFSPLAWLFSSAYDTLSMGEHVTRVELWKKSIHDFLQRPFGYGLGHAGVTAVRFLKHTNVPAAVYTTDGWYLKLACETGIPGLLVYLSVFGTFFYQGVKVIRKNGFTLFTYIFAIFLMITVQNVVENVLDFYPYITLYWFLLGLSQQWMRKQTTSII